MTLTPRSGLSKSPSPTLYLQTLKSESAGTMTIFADSKPLGSAPARQGPPVATLAHAHPQACRDVEASSADLHLASTLMAAHRRRLNPLPLPLQAVGRAPQVASMQTNTPQIQM